MDAFDLLAAIPAGSVDLVLTDIPYGITACEWDKVPDLAALWVEFKRIGKPNAAYVFTASQPFTTDLINSNRKWFKYEWIWIKEKGRGFQVAQFRPMIITESCLIFGDGAVTYNPQLTKRDKPIKYKYPTVKSKSCPIANYNDKT